MFIQQKQVYEVLFSIQIDIYILPVKLEEQIGLNKSSKIDQFNLNTYLTLKVR